MKVIDENADMNEELLAIAQAFLGRHESEGGSMIKSCFVAQ
ncbi:hypothetical protein OKW11_004261 [Pseudomonas baetica]|nr:hypothetical protein [Pseudomonas baetica]